MSHLVLSSVSVSVVPIFFRRMDEGYNFGVSPKPEVEGLIKWLLTSGREGVKVSAARAYESLSKDFRA